MRLVWGDGNSFKNMLQICSGRCICCKYGYMMLHGHIIPVVSCAACAASPPAACPISRREENYQKVAAAAQIKCGGNPSKLKTPVSYMILLEAFIFNGAEGFPCKLMMHWYMTWVNKSWQAAAFLKTHGWHKSFYTKLIHRLEMVGPEKHRSSWNASGQLWNHTLSWKSSSNFGQALLWSCCIQLAMLEH